MGADYQWVILGLEDKKFKTFQKPFYDCLVSHSISKEQEDIVIKYKANPDSILSKFVSYTDAEYDKNLGVLQNGYIENKDKAGFCSIFMVDKIETLTDSLPFDEESVLGIVANEVPPAAVVGFALGLELFDRFPGVYGNMIIESSEIENYIHTASDFFKEIDQATLNRARKFLSLCSNAELSGYRDDDIREIFFLLPRALELAKVRGLNIISVGFWCG